MVHHYSGFVGTLSKMPQGKATGVVIVSAFALSAVLTAIFTSGGEYVQTTTSEWTNANKEFMKFQKMNPIFGISRGL